MKIANRLFVFGIILVLIDACLVSANATAAGSTSASPPPLIIDKVDPWSPLKGLDGIRPCLPSSTGSTLDNWAFAWIEVHNTTNETLVANLTQIDVRTANANGGIGGTGSSQGYGDNLTLYAGQDCLIPTADRFSTRNGVGGSQGNSPPPGADRAGAIVSIYYSIEDRYNHDSKYRGEYQYSTPALSDPYGDKAYWQLGSDGGWSFIDPYAPRGSEENQTILLSTKTDDGSIIVNATIPKTIKSPSMFPMHLTFQNANTGQLLSYVSYKIQYSGIPSITVYQGYFDGFAVNGTDVKYPIVGENGTFIVSGQITGLHYDFFERSKNVNFSMLVVPEFSSGLILLPLVTAAILGTTILIRVTTGKEWSQKHH